MLGILGQDISGLLPHFVTFLFSFIQRFFGIEYCLQRNTLAGRNESDWSIFSGWFTEQNTPSGTWLKRVLIYFFLWEWLQVAH